MIINWTEVDRAGIRAGRCRLCTARHLLRGRAEETCRRCLFGRLWGVTYSAWCCSTPGCMKTAVAENDGRRFCVVCAEQGITVTLGSGAVLPVFEWLQRLAVTDAVVTR